MIRVSEPEDARDIERLCVEQYRRTPWPHEGKFRVVDAFHVCERGERIAACLGFRREGPDICVMHVWAEDGFGGRRSAVELMKDLEGMAEAEGRDITFDTMTENIGLQRAVEEHWCERILGGDPGIAAYRRKARAWAAGM